MLFAGLKCCTWQRSSRAVTQWYGNNKITDKFIKSVVRD